MARLNRRFLAGQPLLPSKLRVTSSAVGDFNGDSFPDLVVANDNSPGTVTVLTNAPDWDGRHPGVLQPPRLHAQSLPASIQSLSR